jgi:hypothetical protein
MRAYHRRFLLCTARRAARRWKFACRACGSKYYYAATANEHALHECRVEDAATIHIPPRMKVVCTEPRCGHWRENTDLGNANMEKHFEAQHVKGKGHCPICQMQWRNIHGHQGYKDEGEKCEGSTRKPKTAKKKPGL